ncbi:MAG: GNAT family N-acetyltransferase [Sporomusa sp.]
MDVTFITERYRIYATDSNGKIIAEITYPPISDDTVDINHTFVDDCLRGQGIAGLLVAKAIKEIQAKGLSFVASCPYASRWLSGHPEAQGQ